jgi:signal peptidase I
MFTKIIWGAMILLVLARVFVFQPVEVNGTSMFPNYRTGDRLIVEQISAHITGFERGQVIVVYSNPNEVENDNVFTRFGKVFYIKRVVGLPGEYIQTRGSETCIYNSTYPDGVILSEDYLSTEVKRSLDANPSKNYPKTKIPDGQYFIMGDNRVDSTDSRSFGAVQEKALLGKEWIRFWPVSESRSFELPKYEFGKSCNFVS